MGAKIYNSDATRALIESAGLTGADVVPQELAEKALPVVDMTPDFHRKVTIVKTQENTATGAQTLYTTSAVKDFYLCGCTLHFIQDVSCDGVVHRINATLADGVTVAVASLRSLTLTAQSDTASIVFPFPILLKRNTSILADQSFTVGASIQSATIYGYEINPPII